jgi:hypothetical protein
MMYRQEEVVSAVVLGDLALLNVGARQLRPGSPGELFFGSNEPSQSTEGGDILAKSPLMFTANEVLAEPDRCGFRLVRRVYQAFGMREDDIPNAYDRKAGRLILPE